MSPLALLVATVIFLANGIVLLRRGLRGRRVGQEPRCGHCEYNLTGLPLGHECPECGRSLNVEGMVVIGARRRQVLLVLVGGAAVTCVLGYWGTLGYQYAVQNKYKFYPLSWVLADARGDVADAIWELDRRYRGGGLRPAQVGAVATTGLAVQARLPRPMNCTAWSDLLEKLNVDGRLTHEQAEQYYQQLILFSIGLPSPRIKAGEPLAVTYGWDSRAPQNVYTAYFLDTTRTIGGKKLMGGNSEGASYCIWPADGGQTSSTIPFKNTQDLAPGRQAVVYSFRLRIYRANFLAREYEHIDPLKDTPVHEQQVRLTVPVEVVAKTPPASRPRAEGDGRND